VAVLGAGDLVSHLHRGSDTNDPANYRFSVFRFNSDMRATHEMRACDLPDIVKLCQVLAFAVDDDGWIPIDERERLRELFSDLDELTRRWSKTDNAKSNPVLELRRGLIKVRVWRRKSRTGPYSVCVVRLYRNGDEWKESTRRGRDDVPVARLVLDDGYGWMLTSEDACE
jgi:hypothetical protein